MKNLKISQKLWIGIAGQLLFVGLLVYFVFALNGKLSFVTDNTVDISKHSEEVKNLASISKDFINDKVVFDNVESDFNKVIHGNKDDKVTNDLIFMLKSLEEINTIKQDNLEVETQLMDLTSKSIDQSNSLSVTEPFDSRNVSS